MNSIPKKNNGILIGTLLIVTLLAIGIIFFISRGIKKNSTNENNTSYENQNGNNSQNPNNKTDLINNILGFGREIFGFITTKKNKNNSGNGNDAVEPAPTSKSPSPIEQEPLWV